MMATSTVSGMTTVNGTHLYYEVRGNGPPLLLIMGATGDAGHLARVADLLAADYTVVTYDRRGNGRSPRPAEWTQTSVEEQADDAAGLLEALGLTPATVFGTSSGGTFALCLVVRHPETVRAVILHEPALVRLCDNPAEVQGALTTLVTEGMQAGGPPVTMERFWRFAAGDANWTGLDDELRQRMVGSAETFLGLELELVSYLPTDEQLAGLAVPVHVLVSEQGLPFLQEASGQLADRLGCEVHRTAGTHAPYADHPDELARTIRSRM
jgi:pimeloyl-ACP methyl ester carboxylesterase